MKVETSDSGQSVHTSVASTNNPKLQKASASPSPSTAKPKVLAPRPSVESSVQGTVQITASAQRTVSPKVVPSIDAPASSPAPAATPAPTASSSASTSSHAPRHAAPKTKVVADSPEVTEQKTASAPKHASPQSSTSQPAQGAAPQPAQHTTEPQNTRSVFQRIADWVHGTFPGHEHAFVGGVVAFFIAILMIIIGPLYSIVICLIVIVGVAIGQYLDGDPKIVRMVSGLFDNDRDQR